jgi:beta-N-acetylhexosaminidase
LNRSHLRPRILLAGAVCASMALLSQAGTQSRVSAALTRPAAPPLTGHVTAACSSVPPLLAPSASAPAPSAPATPSAATAPDSARPDSAASPAGQADDVALAGLSDAQLAGQRVIYSYSGLTPPASLLTKIRLGQAAGVIFFSGNVSSRAQIRAVVNELQHANAKSPVKAPLLMLTDQEGGLVRRIPGAPALSEKQIGLSSQGLSLAGQAGTGAGQNLRGVGINVNLAPVLDVYRAPGNFVDQFERSYSNRAVRVSRLAAAFIEAQQRAGVAATAKHFPGLGAAATAQNTDLRPVTLRMSLGSLRAVDEEPYPSAFAAGARLVMISWAVYPALDAHRPAGLSTTIVTKELRQRLRFRGVTVTDALEAGALRSFGTVTARGVLAARAGMDLLLFSAQNVNEGIGGLDSLTNALHAGKLGRAAFLASVNRVIALRASLGT